MKRLVSKSTLVFCLLLVGALEACGGGSGTSSIPPQVAASPVPVSTSADVVKIGSEAVSLSAGGSAIAKVILMISPGFHVNANPATFSYLIATDVTAGKVDGIVVGTPDYPAAEKKKFQFAEQPLAVYEGEVPVTLKLSAEKTAAAGFRSLPITVRVQACDEEKCFPPATLNSKISVTVK